MKRFSILTLVLSVTYVVLLSKIDSSMGGRYTNAPGDLGHCGNVGCHDVAQGCKVSINSDSVKIVFGNNLTKYKPDSTYTIKVYNGTSNNKGGSSAVTKAKYGFQATAKKITNSGKDSVGQFIAASGQTLLNGGYIGHDVDRIGTQVDGHVFTFQWKAPSKSSYKDTVRIYVAVNESYRLSSATSQDDSIRTKVLVLTCDTTISNPGSSISKSANENIKLVSNVINDKLIVPTALINKEYMIVSVSGQVVAKGKTEHTIDVANLTPGIYYFNSGNNVSSFYKQ